MEKKDNKDIIGSLRMTLTRDQIMTFVGGLHETQNELIEAMVVRSVVRSKAFRKQLW